MIDRLLDTLYGWSIDHFIHWRRHLKEYAWAVVIAIVLRSLVLTIYRIPTGSMIPTFREGDVLIANKFWHGLKIPFTDHLDGWRLPGHLPRPGDVVIFRSPGEEPFFQIQVQALDAEGLRRLRAVNERATFRHAITADAGVTNYVFANPRGMDTLLPDPSRVTDLATPWTLWIRAADWADLAGALTDEAHVRILGTRRFSLGVTYAEEKTGSITAAILETPAAGAGVLAGVLLNSPFGLLPKLLVTAFLETERREPPGMDSLFTPARFFSFHLFPNRFTDNAKDYVKRVIADEGDVVEIQAGRVFVNGRAHDWIDGAWMDESPNRETGGVQLYRVQTNELTRSAPDGEEKKRFPVRQRADKVPLPPAQPFRADLWPYFPARVAEGSLSAQYADFFGPFTVPKGHLFVMGDNRDDSFDARFWGCVPKRAVKGTAMVVLFPLHRAGLIH